jgi:hypothetical protein
MISIHVRDDAGRGVGQRIRISSTKKTAVHVFNIGRG